MPKTPVAFFIFNRPDLTQRVFTAIAAHRPPRLFVVADGPRCDVEAGMCEQARAVLNQINWPCELETNFSVTNLGCKRRVSSGLDWVFSRVDEAIILEDDCLPHADFFSFCHEMLERYRENDRVMSISGDCFAPFGEITTDYLFSRYVHIWGWATWRRAWQHYDVEMKMWPRYKRKMNKYFTSTNEARYWTMMFNEVASGRLDTWDVQWQFACLINQGLSIVPRSNLISNLGFRHDATHTKNPSNFSSLVTSELSVENHPGKIQVDELYEAKERELWVSDLPRTYKIATFVRWIKQLRASQNQLS